jgi:hypothetical protein
MPIVAFIYSLFGRGLFCNGRAAIFYALQRRVAEAILSIMVLEASCASARGFVIGLKEYGFSG